MIKDLAAGQNITSGQNEKAVAAASSFETRPEAIKHTKDLFAASPELRSLYPDNYIALHEKYYSDMMRMGIDSNVNIKILEPEQVVEALLNAVTETRPELRYVVGNTAIKVALFLVRNLSDRLQLKNALAGDKARGFWPKAEAVMI